MTERRPHLQALAHALGIEDGYHSALDGAWVATTDATREALIAAMGFDAGSEAGAERALERVRETEALAGAASESCFPAAAKLAGSRGFGLWTNLYSVRSPHNTGFGHFGDLVDLVRRAAAEGAAFVGLNPLHATTHRAGRFSPYDPVSRLYRDSLYLDLARVPELEACEEARRQLASSGHLARAATLREAGRLDPAATEAALLAALRPLHATFRTAVGDAADSRRRDFRAYCAAEGELLAGFTRFLVVADHCEAGSGGRDWQRWPGPFRAADSPAVRELASRRAEAVELHAWVQFELDRQLGAAARAASDAGLAVGLVTDLALGSAGGGSDTWSRPDLFARGASVGAPPDAFSREGQNWSFPPLNPRALRADGYAWWERLLEANLRHAGGLRIDHALGLRRLFWIPQGRTPREGAYVRQPEAELLARLARISRRQRAVVVAEDLGTVPPGFGEEIRARGLLSSRVLLFERDAQGFRPAADYPVECLASANTHDLPPLAALAGEADLELRRRVGQIPDDAALAALRAERRADRAALAARLTADGLLDPADTSPHALAAAVTAFLCATPARLVAISLDDLAGESEPINLPGVSAERHPSWTRRMGAPLAEIFESPSAVRTLAAIPPERRSRGGRPATANR